MSMSGLLSLAVGIGLVVSLLFTEMFGLVTGGMVVPGYIALHLNNPLDCLMTLAAGALTFIAVHGLSSIVIIYGRRRTVLMILVGYLIGMALRFFTHGLTDFVGGQYEVIGFIIPGLIAIWLDRQGIIETVGALITASVVVRLILVILVGMELRS
jgi:gamma-polyglutamate biosynthesis protein CapC